MKRLQAVVELEVETPVSVQVLKESVLVPGLVAVVERKRDLCRAMTIN